jgi:hypothetical protein
MQINDARKRDMLLEWQTCLEKEEGNEEDSKLEESDSPNHTLIRIDE